MKTCFSGSISKELIMKSVSLTQVVRSHDSYRFLCPIQSWSQLVSLALTLTIGLALISMLFMALDPTAPVAYILIPVLMGGMAPVFAALPARFEVVTRFQARHFLKTLDEAILSMGYQPAAGDADCNPRYQPQARLFRWKESAIAVTVTEHSITVGGPVFVLRMLQHKLTA
jgi:hypothetical protein